MIHRTTDPILQHAATLPEGTFLTAEMFAHLGLVGDTEMHLRDLVQQGDLYQIEAGIRVLPVASRYSKSGLRPPLLDLVLKSYKRQRGETITPIVEASANLLQLTTQVVAKPVYLTTGPSRHISLNGYSVELRHAPAWQTALGNSRAGHVVRAVTYCGAAHADEAVRRLQKFVWNEDHEPLMQVAPMAPNWVAETLRRLVAGEGNGMKGERRVA
jgi:hypothetical protein